MWVPSITRIDQFLGFFNEQGIKKKNFNLCSSIKGSKIFDILKNFTMWQSPFNVIKIGRFLVFLISNCSIPLLIHFWRRKFRPRWPTSCMCTHFSLRSNLHVATWGIPWIIRQVKWNDAPLLCASNPIPHDR